MANWTLGALLATLAIGCGGSPIDEADYPKEVAQAVCAKYFDCCSEAELMSLFSESITDEASCVTTFTTALMEQQAMYGNQVVYDAGAAGDCLASYDDLSCSDLATKNDDAVSDSCQDIYTGTLANGTACTQSVTCQSGYCDNPPSGGSDRVCQTLPGRGDACQYVCADGLACVNDVCGDLVANGGACTFDSDCESTFCSDMNLCSEDPNPDPPMCDGN